MNKSKTVKRGLSSTVKCTGMILPWMMSIGAIGLAFAYVVLASKPPHGSHTGDRNRTIQTLEKAKDRPDETAKLVVLFLYYVGIAVLAFAVGRRLKDQDDTIEQLRREAAMIARDQKKVCQRMLEENEVVPKDDINDLPATRTVNECVHARADSKVSTPKETEELDNYVAEVLLTKPNTDDLIDTSD